MVTKKDLGHFLLFEIIIHKPIIPPSTIMINGLPYFDENGELNYDGYD